MIDHLVIFILLKWKLILLSKTHDCRLQRWKYRFEMSLFNFTTGLLTGSRGIFRKILPESFFCENFQKVLSMKISRTLWRNIPGTELQGSSGARPSKPLSKGCGLVRNSQEGRWKRGLVIKDIFGDVFMVLW